MLFLLYRFLLDVLGIELLGVWAVVLASTSVSRIVDAGLSGGVTKYVARHLARNDPAAACEVMQTAAISVAVSLAAVLLSAYPLFDLGLAYLFQQGPLQEAKTILPYALASVWLAAISGVSQSGLDGCMRSDLRSLINAAGSLLLLLLAYLLAPSYGLKGLALAQAGQSAIMAVSSWILLRKCLSDLPPVPRAWHRGRFTEMLGYGVNFQVNSIAVILFAPVTKALLVKFGGLATAGYYEMAERMILQFRALLVSTNQVMVPVFATLHETDPGHGQEMYRRSTRVMWYLALPLYASLAALSPVISEWWIGAYETEFVSITLLMTVAWFLNTLVSPAYWAFMGSGRLRWNTLAHLIMGILNAGLGILLGLHYGGMGVVAGCALSLILGSAIIVSAYHAENRIAISSLLVTQDLWLALASAGAGATVLLAYGGLGPDSGRGLRTVICLAVVMAWLAPALWAHPTRMSLAGWMLAGPRQPPAIS